MIGKRVRKAVIPAAGLGTRFLPASKVLPKELFPILDVPMIQYVVEEAVAAGMDAIIIVTSRGKATLEEHFRPAPELERALAAMGQEQLLERVRHLSSVARFSYVRQEEPRGLGHAVLTARELVGEEPFAVFLPDDIIWSQEPAIAQMLRAFHRHQASVVAVEEVPWEAVGSYGVVRATQVEENVYRVERLVEKPDPREAPSNLAIVGRYILNPQVFPALERTSPGAKGEIQLTDGMALLLESQPIYAYRFQGTRYDAGTPLGLLRTSLELGLRRDDWRPLIEEFLQGLLPRLQDPRSIFPS